MNIHQMQPSIKNIHGFYIDAKNRVCKLIATAHSEYNDDGNTLIFQPQYSKEFGSMLLSYPAPLHGLISPDFTYIGWTIEDTMQNLSRNRISTKPVVMNKNMLDQTIAELVFGRYAIQGFALDKTAYEHGEKKMHVLYHHGDIKLFSLPEEEFFEKTGINIKDESISKYFSPKTEKRSLWEYFAGKKSA